MKDVNKANPDHLIASNQLLEGILSHLNVAVAVISPSLELHKTNAVFNQLFGLDAADSYTALTKIVSGFWEKTSAISFLQDHYEEQEYNFEKEFHWEISENQLNYIKINSQLISDSSTGDHPNILLLFSDVTEERENEKGRNQRIRFMMHELRNPLSNISLCIELLADSVKENDQEEAHMFLSKAATSVQRMKDLINNLNDMKQATH